MVWTAPMTAAAGAFTAANWNLHIRDNLNMNAPALATTVESYFVSTAANTLVQRQTGSNYVSANFETTTSTSYVPLATAGPTVTITTGTKAIVSIACLMGNASTGGGQAYMSFAVSGATTIAASDAWAVMVTGNAAANSANNLQRIGSSTLVTLNAGSNTFTGQYKVSSNTGTFFFRSMTVFPIG